LRAPGITDGEPLNADISGFIGGLRVIGVSRAPVVEAEPTPTERVKLRAGDPRLRGGVTVIEEVWERTVARAAATRRVAARTRRR